MHLIDSFSGQQAYCTYKPGGLVQDLPFGHASGTCQVSVRLANLGYPSSMWGTERPGTTVFLYASGTIT